MFINVLLIVCTQKKKKLKSNWKNSYALQQTQSQTEITRPKQKKVIINKWIYKMIRISTNHDHDDEADDAAVISNIKTKIIIKPKRIFINVWGILTFVTNQKKFWNNFCLSIAS